MTERERARQHYQAVQEEKKKNPIASAFFIDERGVARRVPIARKSGVSDEILRRHFRSGIPLDSVTVNDGSDYRIHLHHYANDPFVGDLRASSLPPNPHPFFAEYRGPVFIYWSGPLNGEPIEPDDSHLRSVVPS